MEKEIGILWEENTFFHEKKGFWKVSQSLV